MIFMGQVAPKFSELTALVEETLAAVGIFVTASEGLKGSKPTLKPSIVVRDEGLQEKTIEKVLREVGVCVAVMPVVMAMSRDQDDQSFIMDCELMVKVMVNPERNASPDGGAQVNIYAAVMAVIEAMCQKVRHPGGERFKVARDAVGLATFDPGLWTYNLMFTKEALF
jgi:hypothetical protein